MNPAHNYILSRPEPWKTMLIELRAIIKSTIPEAEESFKWGLPFYSVNGKMCCFLNFRKTFVEISFTKGVLIEGYKEFLIGGEKRKNLRSLRFQDPAQIKIKVVQHVLLAAKALND